MPRTSRKQSEMDLSDLLSRLKTFERRQFRINLTKTLAVAAIMSSLVWITIRRSVQMPVMQIGLGIIVLSTVIFMILYWKSQFKTSRLNLLSPACDFIKEAIEKLRGQKKIFGVYFPGFVVFLAIGVNLISYDMTEISSLSQRIIEHLKISVPLFVVYLLAQRIRTLRFLKEEQPVIDHLTCTIRDFCVTENHSERDAGI